MTNKQQQQQHNAGLKFQHLLQQMSEKKLFIVNKFGNRVSTTHTLLLKLNLSGTSFSIKNRMQQRLLVTWVTTFATNLGAISCPVMP